jgi:capsular polysaccharide biosynthesis protein
VPKRTIALISLAVAVVAFLAGLVAIAQRSTTYTAEASVIIVPKTTNADEAAGAIDTLSRGSAVSTLAEAYTSDQLIRQAFALAKLSSQDAGNVTVTTNVLADTSKITIAASSANANLAERAADAVANYTPDLGGYTIVYTPQVSGSAAGSATASGPSGAVLFLLNLIVAAGLGVLVYAVLSRLVRSETLANLGVPGVSRQPHGRGDDWHDGRRAEEAAADGADEVQAAAPAAKGRGSNRRPGRRHRGPRTAR